MIYIFAIYIFIDMCLNPLQPVDVLDVLTCLKEKTFLDSLVARNAMSSADMETWWCRLFYFLSEACTDAGSEEKRVVVVQAAMDSPIFTLVRHCPADCDWRLLKQTASNQGPQAQDIKPGRQRLPPLTADGKWRNAYLDQEDNPVLRFTWRWEHEVTLSAQSVEERTFLSQHLRIASDDRPFAVVKLTQRVLLDSIKRIHLDAQNSQVGSVAQILCDLQLIRQSWDQWMSSPSTKEATCLLYLPFHQDNVYR